MAVLVRNENLENFFIPIWPCKMKLDNTNKVSSLHGRNFRLSRMGIEGTFSANSDPTRPQGLSSWVPLLTPDMRHA